MDVFNTKIPSCLSLLCSCWNTAAGAHAAILDGAHNSIRWVRSVPDVAFLLALWIEVM